MVDHGRPVQDLKLAIGQFEVYRGFLEQTAPDHRLFLAVGVEVYDNFFAQKAVQLLVRRFDLRLLVVDAAAEEIIRWISSPVTGT